MLISKELEAKIIAEISAALANPDGQAPLDVTLSGSWQPATTGLPKWIAAETCSPVHVHVAVGTALPQTFTSGEVDFNVNVSLFVRTDLDTTGELMLSYAERLEGLLRSWQADTYQEKLQALSIENVFYVGDVNGQSGQSPTLHDNVVSISWPLVIGGSYA